MKLPETVAELTDAPYNPREITAESLDALGSSMGAFGDISGFVFNVRTGHLVCGHQRKSQLADTALVLYDGDATDAVGTVGYGHIDGNGHRWPVRFVDWDEAREKAANVAATACRRL